MGKLDDLKLRYPTLTTSLFDIIASLDQSKNRKCLPLFCKTVDDIITKYGEDEWHLLIIDFFNSYLTVERNGVTIGVLPYLNDFANYLDRGRLLVNDVQKYSNFDSIKASVDHERLRLKNEEASKKYVKYYEDDDWLVIQPTNLETAKKYGKGTRWCITMNDTYFMKYSHSEQILLYFIDKKVDDGKIAVHFEKKTSEPTYWDAEDEKYTLYEGLSAGVVEIALPKILSDIFEKIKPLNIKTNFPF